jgi:HEAT repeat protein
MMLVPGALAALMAGAGGMADGKAVQEALRAFQQDYIRSGSTDDTRAQAIEALAQHRHPDVAQRLLKLLTSAPLPARIVVGRELGKFQGVEGVVKGLEAALSGNSGENPSRCVVRIVILKCLGQLKARGSVSIVERYVADRNVFVRKAAVVALGQIRCKSSIDVLLRALGGIEGALGDVEAGPDPLDFVMNPVGNILPALTGKEIIEREIRSASARGRDAQERKQRGKSQREELRPAILGALQAITRTYFATLDSWESWWRSHQRTFRVLD